MCLCSQPSVAEARRAAHHTRENHATEMDPERSSSLLLRGVERLHRGELACIQPRLHKLAGLHREGPRQPPTFTLVLLNLATGRPKEL